MWPNEGAASKPNEDPQAKKSHQGCKKKKSGAETLKKNFLSSMLTTAASDFKKNNKEVVGDHNKMKSFFLFAIVFEKSLNDQQKKSEPGG